MIKVYVIAPDVYSGEAFNKVLNKNNIETEFNFHKIRPRVIENKMTTSNDVTNDLNSIFRSFKDKTKSVVIACNTLQLWLDKVDDNYKKNIKVYTTFEACEWKFKSYKQKPLWLGTTPLVRETKRFPTLLSYKDEETQELVQELIWRIKLYGGDDIKTAPQRVKNDQQAAKSYQKLKIEKIKLDILESLALHDVKNVILGCTELPLVFNKNRQNGISFYDPAAILAEYIRSQSVAVLFCGGTISSIANKKGLRINGKAFDLVEKLSQNLPGTYKNINITKSEIVYSGFSENMISKVHYDLLKSVNKLVGVGFSRIVITHGTDSMEQTARYLNKNLKSKLTKLRCLVVLTGSNDHAGSSQTDAWKNLNQAINDGKYSHAGGVFVAFHGRFIPADEVVKEFFDGKEMNYISNKSLLYKVGLIRYKKWKEKKIKYIKKHYFKDKLDFKIIEYSVNLIRKDHKSFLNLISKEKPDAVLFILYHSSTANTQDDQSSVSNLISELTNQKILCFGITENGDPIDLSKYKSSIDLKNAGLIAV